jgi:uracil-DNA glycosylase
MKRSITDFFSPVSPKKSKYVEPAPGIHVLPRVPVEPAKPAVEATVAPVASSSNSSNELTASELLLIETNRKRALSRQLFNKITDPSWREVLEPEFEKPYMLELANFLAKERAAGKTIYPPEADVFTALNICPLDSVKVVIIGQDPYHQPNQAHGLCFSVLPPTKPPSSLRNMYKELKDNYPDIVIPKHGNLEHWAKQGVLMLNACLTVQRDAANSHQGKGWETFTDACIAAVSKRLRSVVFLLWGSYAQSKAKTADPKKHVLFKAAHPSGLSAHKGFFGCKHFSEVNRTLRQIGRQPIDWQLPQDGTYIFGQHPTPSPLSADSTPPNISNSSHAPSSPEKAAPSADENMKTEHPSPPSPSSPEPSK